MSSAQVASLQADLDGARSQLARTETARSVQELEFAEERDLLVIKGLYSYGLYSYGLYSYGLYIYGLYSYGLYSYV